MNKDNSVSPRSKVVDLSSPDQMAKFADDLKKFIVTQGLYTPIQGKNYVNVEGWQFAGAATGILPVVRQLRDLSFEGERKYRAEVELVRVGDGASMGYGFAVCSSHEKGRSNVDEYVIASMAQTRAIGKAYRNLFAWLMKMAGYEPTPAEDMDSSGGSVSNPDLYDKIQGVNSKQELQVIIGQMSATDLKDYLQLIEAKKKELNAAKN